MFLSFAGPGDANIMRQYQFPDWLMQAILQTEYLSLLALIYFARWILLKKKLNIFIYF